MDHNKSGKLKVGIWISPSKAKKMNIAKLKDLLRCKGFDLIELDLNLPLDSQGPFIIFIHKLTNLQVKAELNDIKSKECFLKLKDYFKAHPPLVFVDKFDSIKKLLDRSITYAVIKSSELAINDLVFTPRFCQVTSSPSIDLPKLVSQAELTYPIVVKPFLAHGPKSAHQMSIVFCDEGLKDVVPPCIFQNFINHNAILYKIYVIGKKFFIVKRPSIRNCYPSETKTIFFDSQTISKPVASSDLIHQDPLQIEQSIVTEPSESFLTDVVELLRTSFDLTLFGIDIVIEASTGRYGIVDVNYFPGYYGIDRFEETLVDHLMEELQKQPCQGTNNSRS